MLHRGGTYAREILSRRVVRAGGAVASAVKTSRIVVVEEGPITGGWAGEVLAVSLSRRSAISPQAVCRSARPADNTDFR